MNAPIGLTEIYAGWERHQGELVRVLSPLTSEQLAIRPSPDMWAIWQLASNMAGGRAYWFHDILGEGGADVRDMFRVTSTTVPGLPLSDAGWEDDETHPRTATELVHGLKRTWQLVNECLERWTAVDLDTKLETKRGNLSRGWVIWHLIEHELQHGTEIAVLLREHGLDTIEL